MSGAVAQNAKTKSFPVRKRLENEVPGLYKAPRERQETARSAPGAPSVPPRAVKSALGAPQEAPGALQEDPAGLQEGPIWTPQERLEGPGDRLGPPGGRPGPPGGFKNTKIV